MISFFFPLHNYVAGSKGMISARFVKAPHLNLFLEKRCKGNVFLKKTK